MFVTAIMAVALLQAPAPISARYIDVPQQAQTDFERAITIWAECLVTDVPIQLTVRWIPRGPTGFAFPRSVRDQPHLPLEGTWYPAALANTLAGDRDTDLDDMNIFLSAASDWHFSNEGEIGPEQKDFINVALHELAHGLGITSVAQFSDRDGEISGSIGFPDPWLDYFAWTFELPQLAGAPHLYDTFIELADGRPVVSFANPSRELGYALANPTVHFAGQAAKRANGGFPVNVTPTNLTHRGGRPGEPNPILLGGSGVGESIRTLDPVLLGMLSDMGWTINPACLQR